MATLTQLPTLALPRYSPPPPVPSYSPEPALGEQRVEHTPRVGSHPTGTFIKKCGGDAIILAEQDSAAELPSYGRHATISGYVSLEDRQSVSEVVLKIKGKMEFMITEAGAQSTRLINDSYTLWSSAKSHTSMCPGAVPFSAVLPTTFRDENLIDRPLPPSFELPHSAMSGLFFKSSYSLSVTIFRARSRKLGFQFLNRSKTICTRFSYVPRMRPWRPIQPSPDFLSDVKIMPEEFRQVSWPLTPRPKSTAQALDLHLFIPAVEIFGLEDTIPFHVQLSGPVPALRQFLPDTSAARTGDDAACISVTLVRQITVELNGRRAARNITIANATLSARPPSADATVVDADGASLDWSGEVRALAQKDANLVGMFDAGSLRVQDFVVVALCPPNARTAHDYTILRHSHAIKLVTDTWVDSSASRDDHR